MVAEFTRTLHVALALAVLAARPGPVPAQEPVLELDHLYIVVSPGAADAVRALEHIGVLVDTTIARHDGEGTSSMAAFFENAYLELLWVDSSLAVDSAHQADAADFRRAAAWLQTGASPFGLGLHFQSGTLAELRIPVVLDPIPDSHPAAWYVLLRQPAESLATDLFIMPADRAITSWLKRYRTRRPDLFVHPLGVQRITRLVVRGPQPQRPAAAALDLRPIQFEEAAEPLLLLEFDGGQAGEAWDLRPALPLILRR